VSATTHLVIGDLSRYGRLWWLPAGGYGNGLDDGSWAPILDIDARIAMTLLAALRDAGVPAYTAVLHGPSRRSSTRHSRNHDWPAYRLWVGSSAHARAEQVLMSVMPGLTRHYGDDAVR
jgi:hypothetical protein